LIFLMLKKTRFKAFLFQEVRYKRSDGSITVSFFMVRKIFRVFKKNRIGITFMILKRKKRNPYKATVLKKMHLWELERRGFSIRKIGSIFSKPTVFLRNIFQVATNFVCKEV